MPFNPSSQLGTATLGAAQLGGINNDAGLSIAPASIESTASVGTPALIYTQDIAPASITSTASIGTPELKHPAVFPPSIASTVAFGTPSLAYTQAITIAAGISSTATLGSIIIAGPISAPSIASTAALGSPTIANASQNIAPASITSSASLGAPSFARFITMLDGIASGASLGMPLLSNSSALFRLWIGGRDRTSMLTPNSLKVQEDLGAAATATFRLWHTEAYRPLLDSEVIAYFGTRKLFAGFIESADEEIGDKVRDGYFINCGCRDYTRLLLNRIISYDYREYTSLKAVMRHIVDVFLSGEGIALAEMVDDTLAAGTELLFNDISVSEAFERISDLVGRDIWIDYDRLIHCEDRILSLSAFRVDDYSANARKFRVKRKSRQYRNVQGIRTSAVVIATREETFSGADPYPFRLMFPVGDKVRPRVWQNGVEKTVIWYSEMGTTSGQVMFTHSDTRFYWDTLIPGNTLNPGDTIRVEYVPLADTDVMWVKDDQGLFQRANRMNGSGRVMVVSEPGEMVSEATASATGTALMQRYQDEVEVQFETDATDTPLLGQAFTMDTTSPFLKGRFIATRMEFQEVDATLGRRSITGAGPEPIAISGATNAAPIVLTTEVAHGLVSGQVVSVYGVEGNTNANVRNWQAVAVDSTRLRLPGTVGNGAYTGGGWLISDAVMARRRITSTSASGTSPVVVTVDAPHGYTTTGSTLLAGDYTGTNALSYPVVSIDGVTGNTNINGTAHVAIPVASDGSSAPPSDGSSTTLLIGPVAPSAGMDIASVSGNGTIVTITTILAHSLTTGMRIQAYNTGITALHNRFWPVTVTGSTTLTLDSSSGITGSSTQGTIARCAGLFASASGDGSRIRITCSQAHGATTGQRVTLPVATGFAQAVGNWTLTVVSSTVFDLDASPYSGSSSDVWVQLWPISNGTAGTDGSLFANFGHDPDTAVSITPSGGNDTVLFQAPHGLGDLIPQNLPNYRITYTGQPLPEPGANQNTTIISVPNPTTVVTSPSFGGVSAIVPEPEAPVYTLPGGTNPSRPGRGGHGRRDPKNELRNILRRTRGKRNRIVERAQFIIAAAIPGYSAAPVQTGSSVTNSYVVANDGVFRVVIVNAGSPPLGGALVLDIKKNGVSILDGQISYPSGQALPLRFNNFASRNLAVAQDDLLSVDVIAVGSDFAGCNITVSVLIGTR